MRNQPLEISLFQITIKRAKTGLAQSLDTSQYESLNRTSVITAI